jgi:tetratricopeptide (TPR) repeat protein
MTLDIENAVELWYIMVIGRVCEGGITVAEQPKTCGLRKMINTVKRCSDFGERFCFVIGAGASISSGIISGIRMASMWLSELKEYEPETTMNWIEENNVDENDIGSHYSKLYEMRFNTHPLDGYIWLQDAMKNAFPSLGYYHLANILAADNTPINLVITTNFDSLTEDAIFMYTGKKPLVVTHELLAQYMDFLANRPIIAKIHRDLMLRPKSSEEETHRLEEAWEPVLKRALNIYSPIIMGYGGNDGSLMGLLEAVVNENGMEKPIYWCHMRNYPPRNQRILDILIKNGGFLVPIDDFDTAMYLFGIEFGHNFQEDLLKKQLDNRINNYKNKRKEIENHLMKEQERRELSADEKAVVSAISDSQKMELAKINENISKRPHDAWVYKKRGDFYTNTLSKYNEAVSDYTKAIELSPNAQIFSDRAICHYKFEEYEKAIDDFRMAVSYDSNTEYYFGIGAIYNKLKNYKEATTYLTKSIELDSSNSTDYQERGESYFNLEEYNKAVADFSRAIELSVLDAKATAYSWRASAFARLNEYESSILDYQQAMEINQNNPFYYSNCAYVYMMKGELETAFELYEKAIEICNSDDLDKSEQYYRRGYYYYELNEFEKALDDIRLALELQPNNASFYFARVMIYDKKREYTLALNDVSKAVELDSDNPLYLAAYNYILHKTGETNKALQNLDELISLHPDESYYYGYRGIVRLMLAKKSGDLPNLNALVDLNKAIEITDKISIFFTYRAYYYLCTDEPDKAYDDLKKSLNIYEKGGRAWYYLSKYYKIIGNTKEYEHCKNKMNELDFIPEGDE